MEDGKQTLENIDILGVNIGHTFLLASKETLKVKTETKGLPAEERKSKIIEIWEKAINDVKIASDTEYNHEPNLYRITH
jgi:hypothetical protein